MASEMWWEWSSVVLVITSELLWMIHTDTEYGISWYYMEFFILLSSGVELWNIFLNIPNAIILSPTNNVDNKWEK